MCSAGDILNMGADQLGANCEASEVDSPAGDGEGGDDDDDGSDDDDGEELKRLVQSIAGSNNPEIDEIIREVDGAAGQADLELLVEESLSR